MMTTTMRASTFLAIDERRNFYPRIQERGLVLEAMAWDC